MDFLGELNKAQQRAATAGDGPVLIVAGPGTGKTKTLAARIAYLIAGANVPPAQILALTFTKKAAEEMRQRVNILLASGGKSPTALPYISTFHALCHELLGGQELQFVSEPARLDIIKKLPKPAALKGLSTRELALKISRTKNMAETDPALLQLAEAYDTALHAQNGADFDDLLTRTRDLLTTDADARTRLQSRFTHLLVDEFQDTNVLQYELLQLLRGNDNVFLIGDPLQSIYGFRGASGSIFDTFRQDFPQATAITLTINYRSVPEVVQLSNALFREAPDLDRKSTRLNSSHS